MNDYLLTDGTKIKLTKEQSNAICYPIKLTKKQSEVISFTIKNCLKCHKHEAMRNFDTCFNCYINKS